MRISDWSSDVCSSDLVWLFLLLVHRRQAQVLEVEAEVRARRDRHHPRLDDLPVRIERKGQERIRVQATVEIGRASCRERVCKYESISVVYVALKKKNNKSTNNIHKHIYEHYTK